MNKIILDGSILMNQETAHDYLKQMLNLPEYYGRNLDALYDCLTELQDVEISIQVGKQENVYLKKVLRVFLDAEAENEGIKVNIVS